MEAKKQYSFQYGIVYECPCGALLSYGFKEPKKRNAYCFNCKKIVELGSNKLNIDVEKEIDKIKKKLKNNPEYILKTIEMMKTMAGII